VVSCRARPSARLVIALENELGAASASQHTGINSTETGLAFYDRCVEILASIEEAERAITNCTRRTQGRLRVNARR